MTDRDIDVERVVAMFRRRLLEPDERVMTVRPRSGWLTLRTDRRYFKVSRDLLAATEPWVDDALTALWYSSSPSHAEDRMYGLVLAGDGQDYLISGTDDDLAGLGRRLSDGMNPLAFAELLALFHTTAFAHGEVIRDIPQFLARFPAASAIRGLRAPDWRRREDQSLDLQFQSYARCAGDAEAFLQVLQWTVEAPAGRPVTWTKIELAEVRL
jgi:hypothetical protein